MGLKTRVDISKNRLYLTITGKAVKKELDTLYTDVRFCVADLRSGFDVVTDLSGCTLVHLSAISTFRKIMNFLITKEVGTIVRVIDGNSLAFKQMLNLSARICGYKPLYASSLEEAEKKLAVPAKRNGVRFQIHTLSVTYLAGERNGSGKIFNLSTSGCAIISATCPVDVGEEISIKFEFRTEGLPTGEFVIASRVVWGDDHTFAVEFTDLQSESKDQLWKCLVAEAQREL